MRIVSDNDINMLGKHAQSQIRKHLEKSKATKGKEAHKALEARTSALPKEPTSKKGKEKHGKTEAGHRFCHFPSPDPFVKIHTALDREFGRYSEGGYHASEVILPGHEIAFRYDFALLPWKVFIESDGFGPHRDLESFNRDRQKQSFALQNGWIVHRVTVRDVNDGQDKFLATIHQIIAHRQRFEVILQPKGRCYYTVIDVKETEHVTNASTHR